MKRRGSYLSASVVSCPVPQKSSRVEICDGLPSDAEAGLTYMKGLFPAEKFEHKLPAIVMKHQVYSIIHDKTSVDRELLALRDKGEVRLFKLGLSSDDYAVVYTEDYKAHLRAALALGGAGGRGLGPGGRRDRDRDTPLYRKFTGPVLSSCGDVSISRSQLVGQLKVSTQDISVLVGQGALVVRDVGSWWFSIPGVSTFLTSLTKGRYMIQQMIKRSKYGELLQADLEKRKMTVSKLGMEYHLHDIIGAEMVECIETTSGTLLRLSKTNSSSKPSSR